uniref:Innexin n=1 Tax=Macrostomum lignano TaxID=282301 RepID=A0A1I8I373_9PLAT
LTRNKEKDQELEQLQQEKCKLQQKKLKEAERIAKQVLKWKAVEQEKLDEASLAKPPDEVFSIVSKLGKGSYGSVYKAEHMATGHTLAIKKVPVDTDLQEIIKEISIMQQCDSPYIVKYYGSYFKDADLWIIMEYCGAGSVSDIMRLRGKTLSEMEIATVLAYTLKGLEYLHQRRKIHRDIKAGNILLNSQGQAKLADFGVAGQLTDTMAKRNTVSDRHALLDGARGDPGDWLQLFGGHLVSGHHGYRDGRRQASLWRHHPMRALFMIPTKPPPSFRNPNKWSQEFIDFVSQCLIKNPADRPSSERLLQHEFIKAAAGAPDLVLRDMVREAEELRSAKLKDEEAGTMKEAAGYSAAAAAGAGDSATLVTSSGGSTRGGGTSTLTGSSTMSSSHTMIVNSDEDSLAESVSGTMVIVESDEDGDDDNEGTMRVNRTATGGKGGGSGSTIAELYDAARSLRRRSANSEMPSHNALLHAGGPGRVSAVEIFDEGYGRKRESPGKRAKDSIPWEILVPFEVRTGTAGGFIPSRRAAVANSEMPSHNALLHASAVEIFDEGYGRKRESPGKRAKECEAWRPSKGCPCTRAAQAKKSLLFNQTLLRPGGRTEGRREEGVARDEIAERGRFEEHKAQAQEHKHKMKLRFHGNRQLVGNDAIQCVQRFRLSSKSVVKEAVVKEAVVKEAVVKEAVVKEAVVKEAVVKEAVVKEAVVKEAVVKEAVVKEAVVKEAVVKEAVVKEAVVKEAVVKEAVVKEAVVKEATAFIPQFAALLGSPRACLCHLLFHRAEMNAILKAELTRSGEQVRGREAPTDVLIFPAERAQPELDDDRLTRKRVGENESEPWNGSSERKEEFLPACTAGGVHRIQLIGGRTSGRIRSKKAAEVSFQCQADASITIVMDAGLVLKLGRIFKTPYGGHGVDFIDQLNYQFTGGLMIMFIAVIGLRQYVGKPIQCWVPQEFSKAWEDFAENYCWVSNTYFLMPEQDIPVKTEQLKQMTFITYYQWVAIVLAGQAIITWIPHLLWRVGARRLPVLIKNARGASIPDTDLRRKAVQCLVAALEEQAEASRRYSRMRNVVEKFLCCLSPSMRLTMLFLIVRILFIGNSIGQIYLMRQFLGTNDTFFGYEVLKSLTLGREWRETGHFPRVTYCHLVVRKVGVKSQSLAQLPTKWAVSRKFVSRPLLLQMESIIWCRPLHRTGRILFDLQCVLPINHFVEKVYVFLWFWFIILGVLTFASTLLWVFKTLIPYRRVAFIKQYLKAMRILSNTEERDCNRFVNINLGADGVFILQVVSNLASDLIALDVASTLWKNYRQAKITGTEEDINRLLESLYLRRIGGTMPGIFNPPAQMRHFRRVHPLITAPGLPRGRPLREVLFAGYQREGSHQASGLGSSGGGHHTHGGSHGVQGGHGSEMDATFMWKLSKLGRIGSSKLRFDDDFADRLNYQFTGVILFLFIGLIGIRQYVGKPIQCWIPQEFTRGWEEYAENYCWVANTYYASVQADHLPPQHIRNELMITYYQWAPIVLAVQALMFYLPCLIWRLFMNYSGFNLRKILQMATDANVVIPEALNKNVRFMARYMEGCIYRQREYRRGVGVRLKHCLSKCSCLCCGKRYGNFLVVLYFFIKVLYLLNVFGQLYIMEKFIGTTYTFFGFRVLLDIVHGIKWYQSSNFPRVTFCDLQAKKEGQNYQ